MCGIAGAVETAVTSSEQELRARGRAMAGRLVHRGPDDEGLWTDPSCGLLLVHRRLSIIDLTSGGHQPMVSASGRFVLVFNGEIYNHVELRQQIEARGCRLRSSSDTEVLLELIALFGLAEALTQCRGMFALALHDRTRRTVSLARDRFGEKPLYYGWAGSTFLFGSECPALAAHPDFDGSLDRNAVSALLRYSFIPAPHSIYQTVQKLRPGTTVEIRIDRPRELPEPHAYWSLRSVAEAGTADPFVGTDEQAVDELDDVVAAAVREAMVADVPLGAFLSGGIDSSLVVGMMQASSSTPVRTYTIGFDDPAYDESSHAKAVAAHLGTDHRELRVTAADALAVIPELSVIYSEPLADMSQIPTTLVSRLAREEVTVALSGDGGDELFGGYGRYVVARDRWRRLSGIPRPLRQAASTALAAGPQRGRRLGRMVGAHGPEDLYRVLLTHWVDPAAIVIGSTPSFDPMTGAAPRFGQADPVALFMQLDSEHYLPDSVLAKVDRAAMSCSLETRVPLLDPRVTELAWRLPMRLRSGPVGSTGKVALRSVLDRYVPRRLVDRPKVGFGVPVGDWLRGPLRPWAEDLLSRERLDQQGLLHSGPVRAAWSDHLSGRRNAEYELWSVLMLQNWLAGNASSATA